MLLETKVGSIANRSLITVDESESVLAAARLMVDSGVGSLVVRIDGQPSSIVTERDLLTKVIAASRNPETTKVSEIMSTNPVTIDQEESLGEALELMHRRRIRRMLVTETGKIVGIFTQRDVLALNRTCRNCGKEIKSALEFEDKAEPYIECECASRYHTGCAKTVGYCVDCSRILVTAIVNPDPAETTGG